MSDSGGDIDDELLELAGATEKKRKRRQVPSTKSSASKRRKADVSMETESEAEPESEEDQSHPYALEGKYVDEADRQRLMQMSEIEREDILAQRLEEMQRIQDKRNLDQMLKDQGARPGDADSVSKAAKRQHSIRGATKEKSRKLDELKARRKAKDEKKRPKANANSPKRDRSSSPMDMETSEEEEEEDGQISKLEEEEEKDRKMFSKTHPDEEPINIDDLEKCRLTRDQLVKFCMAPWFEEYVKGSWVRYLIGSEQGEGVYRICEISNLGAELVKPYKVNDQMVNLELELKHGKSVKYFLMDKVSNSKFQPKEFERLGRVCTAEDVKLPSKRHLEKKVAQLAKLPNQPMTESDITAMLARKNQLSTNKHSQGQLTMEKSRLTQARTLALRRQDYEEVREIDAKLAELVATTATTVVPREEDETDMLAKVNERNRKANMEAVRKAEMLDAERKRRERKLAGTGAPPPHDPSARLKILPRLFNHTTTLSRSGTPNPVGTPQQATSRPISPLPSVRGKFKTFESQVIDAVEVDLGDF